MLLFKNFITEGCGITTKTQLLSLVLRTLTAVVITGNGKYDLVDDPDNPNDDIDTVGELNNLGENSVLDIDLSNVFTESFQEHLKT